jgi:iron(III) transport system substrate-binding protein
MTTPNAPILACLSRPAALVLAAVPPWRGLMRCRGAAAAVAAMTVAASMLAACGGAGTSADPSITLYSGQHEQTTDQLVSAFEKATGITVAVRSDDEDTLADQIALQGTHSPADVFYTENSPPLESLQDKGLLAKLSSATLALTPARYSSPQGDWVGVSARTSVLIYNPALITAGQLPTEVRQLAAPKYQGKLAIAPQETDFQPIVTAFLHAYGRAATISWLQGIKANASGHVYPDNETVANQVNRGAIAFGLINQYYWYRMRAEIGPASTHSMIAHLAPHDPGYVIDVSGAAVLKHSAHAAAARKFVAFLVSRPGQEIIASPRRSLSFEYPVASGVTTLSPETPLASLRPYPITVGDLGNGSKAIALMRAAGLL